ncbi:MAG: hypothetical protein U0Z44_06590 [Kouleothrix sp.]
MLFASNEKCRQPKADERQALPIMASPEAPESATAKPAIDAAAKHKNCGHSRRAIFHGQKCERRPADAYQRHQQRANQQ